MSRSIEKWLGPYLSQTWRRLKLARERAGTPVHVMLAFCDHFEPYHDADRPEAIARTQRWLDEFPRRTDRFRDFDGRPPKHTFFYPIEQYDREVIDRLAALCRLTGCEVEIHLHHERDTPEGLRSALRKGKDDLGSHGLLSTDPDGAVRFAFIHGNWALANCHPLGRGCGVEGELRILREEGCYADLTFPSAPSPTQPSALNTIGYADNRLTPRSLSHPTAARAGEGGALRDDPDRLLMIHGPLGLNWKWRKFGVIPRIENGDLTKANPPTRNRLNVWRRIAASVEGVPAWQFVKLHTHGGPPRNADMFLGDAMTAFHDALASEASNGRLRPHYVSAREMANLIHAIEDGLTGDPNAYRDYLLQNRLPAAASR